MVIDYLSTYYDEVEPYEFYRTIFPEGSFEKWRDPDEVGHTYNGIINKVIKNKKTGKTRYIRLVCTDELELIKDVQLKSQHNVWTLGDDEIQLVLMNGISYCGRSRKSKNARELYAMIIEIDGLLGETERAETDELDAWGHPIMKDVSSHSGIHHFFTLVDNDYLPRPTFVVSSGSGVHLYYVFKEPILLYPDTIKALQAYRKILVKHIWLDNITSLWKNIQYESLFQSFRMVGSPTKKKDIVRAFWTGEKTTMEEMSNFFIFDKWKKQKDIKVKKKKPLTLKQAKEKYPEWYQKRVVEKQPKGTWQNKIDLYYWWIRQVKDKYTVGHRYYSLMCLSAYAVKCGVDQEQLEKDLFDLYEEMKRHEDEETRKNNPITEHDVMCALQVYLDSDLDPHNYTIDFISDRSGIPIQRNKRNGRKQSTHLKMMRSNLEILNEENGSNLQGRKSKQSIVEEWRTKNPNGTKAQCIRDTKLSKPTVYKWW